MFRTRDFILIFTVIVFLVVAIGATLLSQWSSGRSIEGDITLAEVDDREYAAEILLPETMTREERLARMRQKIAESSTVMIRQPEPSLEEETEDAEREAVAANDRETVQLCGYYQRYGGAWPIAGASLDVVDGSRVVYQEIVSEYLLDPATATSGTTLPPDTRREVLVQLPVRVVAGGQENCVPSDVVGIAQDGSLIRNNEIGLYSVFGEATVFGYSLDGFPMRGVSTRALDSCGGAMVDGQYGYYLSTERETMLNCFSSTPVSL